MEGGGGGREKEEEERSWYTVIERTEARFSRIDY